MLTPDDLLPLLLADVWAALPPIKRQARIAAVRLASELGAVHGQWHPDTRELLLNPRLLVPPIRLIDIDGNDPPRTAPWVSRAYHTLTHEIWHAIGTATGLDDHPDYRALSGFVEAEDDPPGTGRYWERRPGWGPGASSWRYAVTGENWFVREYSSKSPHEAFADACTHLTLGWDDFLGLNAAREVSWLRQHVFAPAPRTALAATAERWHQRHNADRLIAVARTHSLTTFDEACQAVTHALTGVIRRERHHWQTAAEARQAWPPALAFARRIQAALRPLFASWGRTLLQDAQTLDAATWAQGLLERLTALATASRAFAETTLKRLVARVTPLLGRNRVAIHQALDQVEQEAIQVRSPLMARTELKRLEQSIAREAAVRRGATTATWQTTSSNPCGWCTALEEGEPFAVDAPIAALGDQLRNAAGKLYTVSYADVWHPPLHPNCACELDYH